MLGPCWEMLVSFFRLVYSQQTERKCYTNIFRGLKKKERKKSDFMLMNITAARVYWREAVRFESSIMTTHAES